LSRIQGGRGTRCSIAIISEYGERRHIGFLEDDGSLIDGGKSFFCELAQVIVNKEVSGLVMLSLRITSIRNSRRPLCSRSG